MKRIVDIGISFRHLRVSFALVTWQSYLYAGEMKEVGASFSPTIQFSGVLHYFTAFFVGSLILAIVIFAELVQGAEGGSQ